VLRRVIGDALAIDMIKALYPGVTPATARQVTIPRGQDHTSSSGQADMRVPERERTSHG
jgi:hypothetical protein